MLCWPTLPCSIIKYKHSRSAAYIKMGQFSKAYQDAVKAKELNAEWPKVRSRLFMTAIVFSACYTGGEVSYLSYPGPLLKHLNK